MSEPKPCSCPDCDGGCPNLGLLDSDDGPICDECDMGIHEQERDPGE